MEIYNIKNVFCWGLCVHHANHASTENFRGLAHFALAILECPPLLGQVVSLFEWGGVFVLSCLDKDPKDKVSKTDALAKIKLVDTQRDIPEPQIISYTKGILKTEKLNISTGGQANKLGKGMCGEVFRLKEQKGWVLKKTHGDNQKEWEIAVRIRSCITFVEPGNFYIKTKKNSEGSEYKLTKMQMKEIQGSTIENIRDDLYRSEGFKQGFIRIYKQDLSKLLKEAKESCLYLFDQKVAWKDVNAQNIFISPRNEDKHLRVIDYGFWNIYEDGNEEKLSIELFLGSIELVSWLLKVTEDLPEKKDKYSFVYPKTFFGKDCSGVGHVHSLRLINTSETEAMLTSFKAKLKQTKLFPWQKLETKSSAEMREVLENYFDAVISSLES